MFLGDDQLVLKFTETRSEQATKQILVFDYVLSFYKVILHLDCLFAKTIVDSCQRIQIKGYETFSKGFLAQKFIF